MRLFAAVRLVEEVVSTNEFEAARPIEGEGVLEIYSQS
jgi:hypothetical protein